MKYKLSVMLLALFLMLPATSYAIADTAYEACVINGVTGDIIYEKNSHERHSMASTTKIMTAIIALEHCGLDEVITVSEAAATQEGSSAYIEPGDQIYMRDMLFGLMLNSGNDAAYAIAEYISGSKEAFADLMNQYAWEKIGAVDTQFINPSGLDGEGHYSTAYDLALIMRYAMRNWEFRNIVATRTMIAHPLNRDGELYFSNHNKLLDTYDGCIGGKTGYTQSTGRTFVSAAERNGMMFIAATIDDNNDWETHSQLLDYAFDSCYPKKAVTKNTVVKKASVDGASYKFLYANDFVVPMQKDKRVELKVVNNISNDLPRPINAGEKVGWADIYIGNTNIGSVDIISESEINGVSNIRLKNSFFSSFTRAFNLWLI